MNDLTKFGIWRLYKLQTCGKIGKLFKYLTFKLAQKSDWPTKIDWIIGTKMQSLNWHKNDTQFTIKYILENWHTNCNHYIGQKMLTIKLAQKSAHLWTKK